MDAEHVLGLTRVVIRRADRQRPPAGVAALRELMDDLRERLDAGRQRTRPRGPVRVVGEQTDVIVGDRDGARRRRCDDPIRRDSLERRDRVHGHRPRRRAVPAVELGEATAAASLDDVDVGAERLQDARGGVAGVRQEVVDDARREKRQAHPRRGRVRLRHLARAVVERPVGDRGEALLTAELHHR